MPKRSMVDPDIQREISRLAALDYSAADIHRMVEADPRFAEALALPSLRTVQTLVRRLRPPDTSGTWSLGAADPATAGLVLDTLAVIIETSDGRICSFTVAEAHWIAVICQARPDIAPEDAWYLARFYVARQSHGEPTDDLDGYLAFAPWRGKEARERYVEATLAGHILSAFLFLYHTLRDGSRLELEEHGSVTMDPELIWQFAEGPEVLRRRVKHMAGREDKS